MGRWVRIPVVLKAFAESPEPACLYIRGQFVRVQEIIGGRLKIRGKGERFLCRLPGGIVTVWREYYWGEWFVELLPNSMDFYLLDDTMETEIPQEVAPMCAHYTLFTPAQQAEINQIIRDVERKLKEQGVTATMTPDAIYQGRLGPVMKPNATGKLEADGLLWGYYRKDPSAPEKKPTIAYNTKIETAAQIPLWADSIEKRRCLVPAAGFYEWTRTSPKKEYLFRRPGNGLFYIAGIYKSFQDEYGDPVERFSMMTTAANPIVDKIHSRMPLILLPDECEEWLYGNYWKLIDRKKVELSMEAA